MLISRTWLTELLADTIDVAAMDEASLLAALTGLGLEVEGSTRHGDGLDTVVVARVVAVRPHPGAERLRVVDVFDGEATIQVVCGAPNVPEPGGHVLFARPGTTLPSGMAIGSRTVRDVASAGMLCSETELDIGSDGDGIVVLAADAVPGTPVTSACPGVRDTVIEISVTPNRPDALGHVGVARDLAVKLGKSWRPPARRPEGLAAEPSLATIEAPDGCGRYYGVTLDGATIGRSPWWARVRLHRLGLRPLSNAVDVTNLMLMKWGQPLHAFDRDVLTEGRVVVRRARAGEPLRTLDGRDLVLTAEDLVIADAARPMALAGVMGGASSGVSSTTSRLLLEAAWFHPGGIRRTARRHGIATDSSHRFERGVDHGSGLAAACAEATSLLAEWTGATPRTLALAEGDVPRPVTIGFRPQRCDALLGLAVDRELMRRILDGVGVDTDATDDAAWRCTAPSHRPDLEREVDLVDEVIRHHGLDRLPAGGQAARPATDAADRATRARARTISVVADALREQGLHEVVSLAFARPEAIAATGDDPDGPAIVRLANPMRSDAAALRVHLLPGLLDALAINVARHGRAVDLFECGRTYRYAAAPTSEGRDGELPIESTRAAILCGATTGSGADLARRVGGILLQTLRRTGANPAIATADANVGWLHPGAQAQVVLRTAAAATIVGRFGVVHPDLVAKWQLPRTTQVAYGELALEHVHDLVAPTFRAVARFPGSSRDVSIDIAASVPVARVIEVLTSEAAAVATTAVATTSGEDAPRLIAGAPEAPAIMLVEDYKGGNVGAGRRALLLRLHYAAASRTVTDAEVQAMHEAIVTRACERLAVDDPSTRRR